MYAEKPERALQKQYQQRAAQIAAERCERLGKHGDNHLVEIVRFCQVGYAYGNQRETDTGKQNGNYGRRGAFEIDVGASRVNTAG